MRPQTKYARSGDVSIAYQVVGSGPRDIVLVPGFVSNIEVLWEEPSCARFLERLASFGRLILFDKRGTGLSDRVADMPNLETRMDDVRAVMDAARAPYAALVGLSEGAPMSILFAATYPERTLALVLIAGFARRTWGPDYPYGPTRQEREAVAAALPAQWGEQTDAYQEAAFRSPSTANDPAYQDWYARMLRLGASPGAAQALMRMNAEIDVRAVLPAIGIPTLVLHRAGDKAIPIAMGRYLGAKIPGAKFVELAGDDHHPWVGESNILLDEIQEFLTGARGGVDADRILATVLFTDIVSATTKAAELGDLRWRDMLGAHHAMVRAELSRFRGREIDTAGDGFLAAFDGPARGIRAASAISIAIRKLGLEVRVGLHTGECHVMGDKLSGIAVHIGARIAALAGPGEVLVSSTVKDLVAGSGLRFRERGVHELKGVPGAWQLYSVEKD